TATGSVFRDLLATDTATLLTDRLASLPGRLRYKPQLLPNLADAVAILALLAALLVPTQLDSIKTERDVVRTSMEAQAQKLADLKAEIVTRPDIPSDLKQALTSELDALATQLRSQQVDRADALATIADAEQKIRSLGPQSA